MLNTILFDLDGTLLPLDADLFIKLYFGGLSTKASQLNTTPEHVIESVWKGTYAMMKNDGKVTNEKRFWEVFSKIMERNYHELESVFSDYYQIDFDQVQVSSKVNPLAKQCIRLLKEKGCEIVLATNPLFPEIATKKRIKWAGLDASDFSYITTYENSSFCKPNPNYFKEILAKIQKQPSECMMVGNDATEDLSATQLGINTYLITDCLINSNQTNLDHIPHGDFKAFYDFILALPSLK